LKNNFTNSQQRKKGKVMYIFMLKLMTECLKGSSNRWSQLPLKSLKIR